MFSSSKLLEFRTDMMQMMYHKRTCENSLFSLLQVLKNHGVKQNQPAAAANLDQAGLYDVAK